MRSGRCEKCYQNQPQMVHNRDKMVQNGGKTVPKCPPVASRWLEDGLKKLQAGSQSPQMASIGSKTAPRGTQDGPQKDPRWPKISPEGSNMAPKMTPRGLHRVLMGCLKGHDCKIVNIKKTCVFPTFFQQKGVSGGSRGLAKWLSGCPKGVQNGH